MLAIDTNIVVRFLTRDHPTQSARAKSLIDAQPVFVALTVFLEAEWVLRSAYGFEASQVVQALRAFAGLPNVTAQDEAVLARALAWAESGMDFADALHLAQAGECDAFASFDARLVQAAKQAGVDGVQIP
jgi:predicted nucleic acid-binding protein